MKGKLRKIQRYLAMFRIWIHRFRIQIRIHHSRLNINPDTDPDTKIRIQGFDGQIFLKKYTAWKKFKIFWLRIGIYLSIGLYKGRPSYRRSLLPSKENIQHFKTQKFLNFFLFLWVIFCPLGSRSGFRIRIRIQ